jgi:hypothetical protein
MLILVPWKPVVLAWVMLSGLVLVGFVGSSLLEGKNPLAMEMGNSPRTTAKHAAYHSPPSQQHAHKAAPTKSE